MTPQEAMRLVLEARLAAVSAERHRLAAEEAALREGLRRLRTGEDAGLVSERLRAAGVREG